MKNIKDLIELPDFITLVGTTCGLASIFLSLANKLNPAAGLLLFCPILDWLDGKVARQVGRQEKVFGEELDNLSDTICFGVAVAILGYGWGLRSLTAILVLIIFNLCVVLRLARFKTVGAEKDYYQGMPAPVNALIFPLVYFIMKLTSLPEIWELNFIFVLYILSSMLMISSMRWKKSFR